MDDESETAESLTGLSDYRHSSPGLSTAHPYLIPAVLRELARLTSIPRDRLFELGCGTGAVASVLTNQGYSVTGVDPSTSGIALAKQHYPALNLHLGSAYDDLKSLYGQFPVVISLEVVEHVFAPRRYAATLYDLLEPGGTAVVSTPYHGYWKNVALAATGQLDKHFETLVDVGHIKFWSRKTLARLLQEAGFANIRFRFAGRYPPFAKSMLAVMTK